MYLDGATGRTRTLTANILREKDTEKISKTLNTIWYTKQLVKPCL